MKSLNCLNNNNALPKTLMLFEKSEFPSSKESPCIIMRTLRYGDDIII